MGRQPFSSLSRRSFLYTSAATSAAMALRIVTEPMLAYAALPAFAPNDAVRINSKRKPARAMQRCPRCGSGHYAGGRPLPI